MIIYGKYRKWLEYESIKEVIDYWAAKNGGYDDVPETTIYYGLIIPVARFINFLGYEDPDTAIKELKKRDDLERLIIKWRTHLVKLGQAPQTVIRVNRGVKIWLEMNDVDVDWEKVNKRRPVPRKRNINEDRSPTVEELRRIVLAARPKMQALILLAASSGLRLGALVSLKIEDLNFDIDNEIGMVRVRPENSKNKYGYYSLFTKEARDALIYYFEIRRSNGEVLTKDSWVFPGSGGRHIHPRVVLKSWVNLLHKTGLDMKSPGGHYILHFHTLRKFFRTRLDGYLTKSEIERLMGHLNTQYLDGVYFKPPEKHLINRYKAASHRLTIIKEDVSTDIRKQTLIDMAKILGFSEEQILKLRNMLEKKTVDQVIEEIRRFKQF